MDPNILKSGTFDVIWRKKMLGNYNGFTEQFYAQPLVFTPPSRHQRLYVISQQNIAYIMNATTGDILQSRQLKIPFLVSPDLEGCNDISDCIGSTATGVIDPETGTWYLTTKTYEDQTKSTPQGLAKGRYWFHALDVATLVDRKGFPVLIDGTVGDNAPWRMFEGGKHHQRPALMLVRDFVYAGFASHCVQWNFTGWVMGWNKYNGKSVAAWAMEGGKEKEKGIGGGVWMSGGGIASDNLGRMFFATGNGYASQLANEPIPGRSPPTALEEAVVNMVIKDDGSLSPVDFFMPWEKRDLDAMDKDLGTSGFVLLDAGVFKTDKVKRIGCIAGKTGKLYFLDLEDLGGYQMGPGRKDKVLQTVQMPAPVFSSAGSYPGEGGWVYITPVGKQAVAFKFGKDSAGNPVFTQAGVTAHTAAGRQGVGHGTVTSMNGQPGSCILWLTDVEGVNFRAYGCIPDDKGILPALLLVNNPGQSKFSRPTFGDGRVYLTTANGYVTALGSPVNMPFACKGAPLDAGMVLIGGQTVTEVKCVAKIGLVVDRVEMDPGATHFNLTGVPRLPAAFVTGATLTFNVIFKPLGIGPLGATINIRTTNSGRQPYAINTPVVIRGIARSIAPILVIQPNVLSFGEIITGSNESTVFDFAVENAGEGNLTVNGYKWSIDSPDGPYLSPAPTANAGGVYTIGPFNLTGLLKAGGIIRGNDRVVITTKFAPTKDGYFKLYLVITTTGGTKTVGAFGSAGSAPKAFFEWKTAGGTWIPYVSGVAFTFGPVLRGNQEVRTMRLTNKGGTTLTTTISKPPVSGSLAALNGLASIAEGSQLAPNASEEAQLICAPPKGQVNMPPLPLTSIWTFNNNDPTMGKQVIQFTCAGTSPQLGPASLSGNNQGRYRYLGCYKDADPERKMESLLYYRNESENGGCMSNCFSRGWRFAATEYEGECWCGNKTVGSTNVEDVTCGYLCKGDYRQYCGGDGAYMSLFGDEERYDPNNTSTTTKMSTSATVISSPASALPPITTTTITAKTTTETPRPDYMYLGCYLEPPTGLRALSKDTYTSDNGMTTTSCQGFCTSHSYPLSGTEYSSECYCGTTFAPNTTVVPLSSNVCNMPCSGAPSEICGGRGVLSVWNNTILIPTPEPKEVGRVGEYNALGCYAEGTTGRALDGAAIAKANMTVEGCVGFCQEGGWPLAGVEYSTECFCGKELQNGAVKAGDGGCNMVCGGDKLAFCGGYARLNIYSRITSTSKTINPPASTGTPKPTTSPLTRKSILASTIRTTVLIPSTAKTPPTP
ncbi:WSC-domain-containing protein [Terfezia boudieri ATCC MYA-4762]|uniref:WSC-domain-containing protein n=1 Tax=Terfezia boudieri ATCC MYA-4762 TaxID=1051890 RepID=A0A3N4LAV8_9PEZI|nr:WSC-domain-containing protein [Terfezia boudieri ATCC MYA-4762]